MKNVSGGENGRERERFVHGLTAKAVWESARSFTGNWKKIVYVYAEIRNVVIILCVCIPFVQTFVGKNARVNISCIATRNFDTDNVSAPFPGQGVGIEKLSVQCEYATCYKWMHACSKYSNARRGRARGINAPSNIAANNIAEVSAFHTFVASFTRELI